MKFHKATDLFPPMTADEFSALKADIAANGLQEPLWTYKGEIIDGRNRYRACQQLGIEPACREWDGEGSVVAFVVSANLHRRHLTSSQKAAIAVGIKRELAKEAKQRQKKHGGTTPGKKKTLPQKVEEVNGEAAEQAAQLMGTNRQYVYDAERLEEEAPELFERVKAGTLSLPKAHRQVSPPKAPKPHTLEDDKDAFRKLIAKLRGNWATDQDKGFMRRFLRQLANEV
jgi:hypothetical protein